MRCFFAILLPEDLRDDISRVFSISDKSRAIRRIPDEFWHLNLAFCGEVEESQIKELIRVGNRFRNRPGSLLFESLDQFPLYRAKYLIATTGIHPESAWRDFVHDLRTELKPVAPHLDNQAWVPHVTLAKAQHQTILDPWHVLLVQRSWKPKGFALIQSRVGDQKTTYRIIHQFLFES